MSWLFGVRTALVAALLLTSAMVLVALGRGIRSRRRWHRRNDTPEGDHVATDEHVDSASQAAEALVDGQPPAAPDARVGSTPVRRASPAMSQPEALDDICAQWMERTGIPVEFRAAAIEIREDARIELAWIVREALRNVEAHARARHVTIDLIRRDDTAELHVADNGVGFTVPKHLDQLQRNGHQGLAGMVERAKVAGGGLEIRSTPGGGTRIIAILPTAPSAPSAVASPARLAMLAAAGTGLLLVAAWILVTGPDRAAQPSVAPVGSTAPLDTGTASPEPRSTASPTGAGRTTPSPSKPPQPSASESPGSPTPSSTPAYLCTIRYVLRDQTKSSFAADLHITNYRSTSLTGWVLRFSFAAGQQITGHSSGITVTQHGRKVSITGVKANATLAAGQTVVVSIQGRWTGQNDAPSAFTLDDAVCGG